MDIDTIIKIASFALAVIAFAWGLYERVKANATAATSEFIAQAQGFDMLGREKMAFVVGQLYEMIPAPFKKFLNKTALESLAQGIYDYMKKYANAYVESKNGKGEEAFKPVNDEFASQVAESLSQLGTVGLKALAVNMNIEITGLTDAELIQAIAMKIITQI